MDTDKTSAAIEAFRRYTQAFQSLDGSDAGAALDVRLQAFLAGEKMAGRSGRT